MSSLPFHTSDHLRKLKDVQRSVAVGVKQIVHHLRALLGDSRSHDAPKGGAAQSVRFCKAFVAGQSKKMRLTGNQTPFDQLNEVSPRDWKRSWLRSQDTLKAVDYPFGTGIIKAHFAFAAEKS